MLYNLLPIYVNQTFNIRLDSPLKCEIINIVALPEIEYGLVNKFTLEIWTEDTINSYLNKDPLKIFKTNIDFSKYFSNSSLIIVPDQGILLAGEAIKINKDRAIPHKNFVDSLYRQFKKNLNN